MNSSTTIWPVDSSMVHSFSHDMNKNPLYKNVPVYDVYIIGILKPPSPELFKKLSSISLLELTPETTFFIEDHKGIVPIVCHQSLESYYNETMRLVTSVECYGKQTIKIRLRAKFIEKLKNPVQRVKIHKLDIDLLLQRLTKLQNKLKEEEGSNTSSSSSSSSSLNVTTTLNGIQRQIVDYVKQVGESKELGVAPKEISKVLVLDLTTVEQIMQDLASEGILYDTVDEHYKFNSM